MSVLAVFDLIDLSRSALNGAVRLHLTARLEPGLLREPREALLLDDDGRSVQGVRIEARSRWPGGSVEWIGLECAGRSARGRERFDLVRRSAAEDTDRRPDAFAGRWTATGTALRWEAHPGHASLKLALSVEIFQGGDDEPFIVPLEPLARVDEVERRNAWSWRGRTTDAPDVRGLEGAWLSLCAEPTGDEGRLEIELGIHNPRRAVHADGFWDLGDPGSVLFDALRVRVHVDGAERVLVLRPEHGAPAESYRSVRVVQRASGNATGSGRAVDVPSFTDKRPGYELHIDGKRVAEGERADPAVVAVTRDGTGIAARAVGFWQEYPAALEASERGICWDAFAVSDAGAHELQPGERKHKTIVLLAVPDVERAPVPACAPLSILAREPRAREWLLHSSRLPSPFDQSLLSLMLEPEGFIAKRELADEYGWRDHGEVFADHESLYVAAGEPLLRSHYNNQYDLVGGFLSRFMTTDDPRWLRLGDDLARHVADIDVYRTDRDRCEYNNGLFWHTNHYTDAVTSTHRTYSRHNRNPADPASHGGGPGAEHCYTTGLTLHWLLTGHERSRRTVFDLVRWMIALHEGDPSIVAGVHAVVDNELREGAKALRRGGRPWYRYPMTRGTGNFVEALLDAHLLDGDASWLLRAENVLMDTWGPQDDVEAHGFDDVEGRWSYVVLMQAALRYLDVKEARASIDDAYRYVQHAFRTYARWMVDNEMPYLERPERLEFPNATWAAQDIRRVTIFRAAAAYDPGRSADYRSAADRFAAHVFAELRGSEQTRFARLQALIFLNAGIDTHFVRKRLRGQALECALEPTLKRVPGTARRLARSIRSRVKLRAALPRLSHEWTWINDRLGRVPLPDGHESEREG